MGVGLSALMGLQAATFFMVFTYLRHLGFMLIAIPILYASLVYFLVAIAAHPSINLPILLGKSTDGRFPIWSLIMLSPYIYFVRLFSALRRLRSGEAPYSEISEGLFVGGWPYSFDNLPPGNLAIIDCTCEFPRKMELSGHAYLCIPTWDTRSPQPAEIESAVKWACRKRAQKIPIFVHCAYGHGRSVAVMCALLIALGLAEDWKNAEKLIQEKRPCIQMNGLHRKSLEEWSKHRLSSPTENHEVGDQILGMDSINGFRLPPGFTGQVEDIESLVGLVVQILPIPDPDAKVSQEGPTYAIKKCHFFFPKTPKVPTKKVKITTRLAFLELTIKKCSLFPKTPKVPTEKVKITTRLAFLELSIDLNNET